MSILLLFANGTSNDSLTADGLAVGTPALVAPAFSQNHALTANAISTSPVLASSALSQNHALVAAAIFTTPALASPAVSQNHALTPAGISTMPELGSPSLGGAAEESPPAEERESGGMAFSFDFIPNRIIPAQRDVMLQAVGMDAGIPELGTPTLAVSMTSKQILEQLGPFRKAQKRHSAEILAELVKEL